VLPAGLAAPTTVIEGDVYGAPPWEVLQVSPAAPTIIVGEDVDGGPLGGAVGGLSSAHHRC
jgi:hypothetical protein